MTSKPSSQFPNLRRLLGWYLSDALPFWSTAGIDSATGGAFEAMHPSGEPVVEADRRSRVQMRQIFVLSQAVDRGWLDSASGPVKPIWDYLGRHSVSPHSASAYVHSVSAAGKPVDERLDTYDLAFTLLACAWWHRVSQDPAPLDRAAAIQTHLDSHLKSAHGGWLEGNYPAQTRRQNPHMHLLEAYLALFECTRDERWLVPAREVVNLFETVFLDAKREALLEFFDEDWMPQETDGAHPVEPGHMMEWAWLLHRYAALTEERPDAFMQFARSLYQGALANGMEPGSQLLFDTITAHGEPLHRTKRLWPQTEGIRTSLVMARLGESGAEQQAEESARAFMAHFVDGRFPGTCHERLSADNRPVPGPSPASSVYHLAAACGEIEDYLSKNPARD